MPEPTLDVAVIGAGPSGIAVSYFLKQHGLRHILFERGTVGDTWRTQRWDSFRLNSPNRFNVLPGDTYRGSNPDGFDSALKFVAYLEGYVNRFRLPLLERARVDSVERNSSAIHVTATVDGAPQTYSCRQVVVASGSMNTPRRSPVARDVWSGVTQHHAGEYRSPSQLAQGAVLVAGGAQSGLQIAEDLLAAGRRVYLSTSAVGRAPRRYRGKDILEWLLKVGFYDIRTDAVTNPKDLLMRQPQVSGVGPLGHTLSLQSLAEKGAVILGRIDSAGGSVVRLQPNAADHVRFGDQESRMLKGLIDQHISENKLDAPQPESDPADEPDVHAACASSRTELDLRKENIRTIIWATGFNGDFSFLGKQPLDANGRPVHRNGISDVPGVYFVGFPWLRKRKSAIINGMVEDAGFIAENVMHALSEGTKED